MPTIVFAYEFGAGLGHLNRLVAVAKRLPRSFRLFFLVPDLVLAEPVIQRALGRDVTILQGAQWKPLPIKNIRNIPTITFADVIRLFGFHERSRLKQAVLHVERLIQTISPTAIVADFAPTLRLASLGTVPTIVVGNGYTVPPSGSLYSMRSWAPAVPEASRRNEDELINVANEIQTARQRSTLTYFSELFHGERTFVCTIAEFDPYNAARTEPVVWPFNVPDISPGSPVRERGGPSIYAYFQHDHPNLPGFLTALSLLRKESRIYVSGVDPNTLAAQCGRQTGIYKKPADFAKVLPRTSLLIHHGGLGTAYAGLMAGVPQLVFPLNLEHTITSRGITQLGAGRAETASSALTGKQTAEIVETELGNEGRQLSAWKTAHALAIRKVKDPMAPVIAACLDQLR